MSDSTPGSFGVPPVPSPDEAHQPRHRLEGVPVDAVHATDVGASVDEVLSEDFGQDPDTAFSG